MRIYGPDEQRDIAELVDIVAPPQTPESVRVHPDLLAPVEVIFSGWGAPKVDATFLQAAPHLKAFFYGAGATGGLIAPEAFARGLIVTSAATANGVPVAEWTVAAITLCLKQVFRLQRATHTAGAYVHSANTIAGAYGSTVALISLGAIGRLVIERLRGMLPDVRIVVYDPFVTMEEATRLRVERVTLDEAFARADVVSLHTPWLTETERMIRGTHLQMLKPGASLINTARGAVIAEDEMIAVLTERTDLTALLDVTYPEPPPVGSPLYSLPNVFLTPHIAGSVNDECRRMGRYMVDELRRYLAGEDLRYRIRPETAAFTSHRVPGTT